MTTLDKLIEKLQLCEDFEMADKLLHVSYAQKNEMLDILNTCQQTYQERFDDACQHIDCVDYLIYELERKDVQQQ